MERRLQSRYLMLVRSQMSVSPRTAAGPVLLPATAQAASLAQAAWRFYNNPRVGLPELVVPLRRAGVEACHASSAPVVLLVHDWSKIDYCPHTSKADRRQLTHQHDIGYDLTTSLLMDAHDGTPIAPVELHLKTADAVHSTSPVPPPVDQAHVYQIEAVMERSATWGLSRPVVHVIDREADSLGHFRRWQAAGHLFLVRCDDRRVLWNGEPAMISEICVKLLENGAFSEQSRVTHKGVAARQQVAQTEVVLHRPHKTRVGGVQKDHSGPPLRLRLVVSRILDEAGGELARWTLLTNAPESDLAPYNGTGIW
ncbi:hypothetical protein [Planctopirus hydrillae]|uniref:Transposase IS4-like domain-containing protein n=1 Tax=Planctopirus hydrillae TaxID=1841610 RepID=A0A1C3EIS7_9PLAN|nr:hypothetical protein [Planctopirus hydrillae]ODA33137.1 hypothetical protein A6X21_05065 [Planctopirus hydrillae]